MFKYWLAQQIEDQMVLSSKKNKENQIKSQLKSKSNFFHSQLGSSSLTHSFKSMMTINDRFILKHKYHMSWSKGPEKNRIYKGIDPLTRKFVMVYIRPHSKQKPIFKNIKEEIKEKIAPPIIWHGTQKIDNNMFYIEVHQKYGPSLAEIMQKYHRKISDKTLYVLTYQILRLIDKIDTAGYCITTLTPDHLVLSEISSKTTMYLLNLFDLEQKGQQSTLNASLKYSSIGTSLKLKTSSKDMVESMCYILIDFYTKGKLFQKLSLKTSNDKQYNEAKSMLYPQYMPYHFLQFFNYIKNLSHHEEIKFSQWKLFLKKLIYDQISQPYEWAQSDEKSLKKSHIPNNDSVFQGFQEIKNNQDKPNPQPSHELKNSCEQLDSNESGQQLQLQEYSSQQQVNKKISQFSLTPAFLSNTEKYL